MKPSGPFFLAEFFLLPLISILLTKGEYKVPATRENCLGGFVRRKYPDLKDDNFQAYNNLVSKLRARAKARGFDTNNLTQEQFDTINSDSLEPLEKGDKVTGAWEYSSMAAAMIRDGERYLKDNNDYWNKLIVNGAPSGDGDTIRNYLLIPSTIKMVARSMKWNNEYLKDASMLDQEYIDIMKKKLEDEFVKADVNNEPACPLII